MNRVILSVLFVACQCSVAVAQDVTAPPCLWPKEKAAFEIVTLKNTLMVAALSCGQDNDYNDVMTRFQPFMTAEQTVVDGYFERVGGQGGRAQEDGFITQLSNDASQEGDTLGDGYCSGAAALFDAVLSVPDDTALQALADQNEPQQGGPDTCGTQVATAAPGPDHENERDDQPALAPPDAPAAIPTPPVASPAPPAGQAANLAAEMPQAAPIKPAAPPRIITGWTPPAPVSAVPLPGSSALVADHQPTPALRKPEHRLYVAAHHAVPAAKPAVKPTMTVVQI